MNTVATELLPLSAEDFATLEAWLSARRMSFPETPDWEFCEGFMAALVCCRRAIAPSEYWPRLLGLAADAVPALWLALRDVVIVAGAIAWGGATLGLLVLGLAMLVAIPLGRPLDRAELLIATALLVARLMGLPRERWGAPVVICGVASAVLLPESRKFRTLGCGMTGRKRAHRRGRLIGAGGPVTCRRQA